MFLERLRTTDLDPTKKYAFVIPMGATEQHGPFLAIGADSFLADIIIKASEVDFPEIIFLPTLRITCSEEHAGFMGSVWLSKDTMTSVLLDICHSIAGYAKTIAFTSFHGGNLELLDGFVLEHAKHLKGIRLLHIPMGSEGTEQKMRDLLGGPTDHHAGNVEISMMLTDDDALADVPSSDYPKKVIENPFHTNRIKDFSDDGIADNHPEWIVSKENGKKMNDWIVQDFKNELGKL